MTSPLALLLLLKLRASVPHGPEELTKEQLHERVIQCLAELEPYLRGHPRSLHDSLSPLTVKELERYADRLLRTRVAADYFRPIEQSAQVWIARGGRGPDPRWFDADLGPFGSGIPKPVGGLWTSSRIGSLVSGWISYLQDGPEGGPPPYYPWELRVDTSARIYEIKDAVSWRWLSTTYPRELDGRLAPDWTWVSGDWDGVHLSTMGLLLTYGVTWPNVAALHGWDCESTLWLRWSFSPVVALPVVTEEQMFRPEAWLPFLGDIVDPPDPGHLGSPPVSGEPAVEPRHR